MNPDANFDEDEFYFRHQHEPRREEHRAPQDKSGYPIRLPIGLKRLKSLIKSFTDILGPLMQPTDRPYVDHLASHEFTSSLTLNMLTLNHGNLTTNPKLDNRELKYMSMKERPLIMMVLQNSAHIICLNEADAFLYPEDETSKDLIKLFIRFGYKGIVRFGRGGKQARVELLRHRNVQMLFWSCAGPDYEIPVATGTTH